MKGTALLFVFCACLAAQQAGIEGIAINSVTSQPLSGVHVRLFAGASDGVKNNYGAMSDSAGHFSITGMQPGAYILTPEKTGFVHMAKRAGDGPASSITLKAGQRLTGFRLEMTPRAVISGRVLDEYGEPVANVMVDAEPISRIQPLITPPMFRRTSTNDRGEFRISGGPGKYRIKATPYTMRGGEEEIRTDGSSAVGYGPTYYPGTASKEQGGIVEAAAGGDTAGIEIRLVHLQHGLTISGVVSGIPQAGRSATVMLQSGDSAERMNSIQGRGTSADGKFVLSNLQPQFYRVFAQYRAGKVEMQSQVVELSRDSSDITHLELVLRPGEDLTGKLEMGSETSAEKRLVRLEPVIMSFGGWRTAEVEKDGAFRFSALLPGKFRVHVEPLPENAYLKAIQMDGVAVAGEMLDFSRGHASNLQITVGRNGGRISGAVLDKDGERLVNGLATVFLQQAATETQEHPARVTPEGEYAFRGVRPGKYRLIAIDSLRYGMTDMGESMKKLFAAADEIEIKEGDRISRDVKVTVPETTPPEP